MIGDPTAAQIVAAVAEWLAGDAEAPAGGFARRVARNALEIVGRELTLGPPAAARAAERLTAMGLTDDADLVAAIRDGRVAPDDPALLAHLRAAALDALAIDQPKYAHELG